MTENPAVHLVMWLASCTPPPVEIELTDLPKTAGAHGIGIDCKNSKIDISCFLLPIV